MSQFKLKKDIKSWIKEAILIERNGLDNLIKFTAKDLEDAVLEILECNGKVFLAGVGKSGHVAKKIASTFSSTGTPS